MNVPFSGGPHWPAAPIGINWQKRKRGLQPGEFLMKRLIGCVAVALGLVVATPAPGADKGATNYHVIKTIPLGGQGGWDYLTWDADGQRLFITRGTHVMVVDPEKPEAATDITPTPGVHGVALAPDKGRGFISNGGDNTVTVFDLKTLKEQKRVKVGQRPDAIIYDQSTGRVFTFNAGSRDATAVDAETCEVAGKVPLGGKPEFAAADGKGHVYVNIEDKGEIVAFDAKDLKVLNRWPLAPGEEPSGLAIDREHNRLFATCGNRKMIVLDAESGKVLGSPAIGNGTDACVFDPGTGLAFSSNRDGTLTVVHEEGGEYKVVQNAKTKAGARTMALDPKAHRIYLVTAKAKAPPAGTTGRRRPTFEPGSFMLIVVGDE